MKSTQRQADAAAGFLMLSLASTAARAQQQPQQRGKPGSDTPYILVATFHSPDRQLGVDMADELRKRLQSEHSASELFVITKNNIDATLTASGYRPDSALNASDLMELAKQLRGEQVVDGTATKGANGVHVETRLLMKSGQQTIAQPLPPIDAKDAGDAAKQLERSLSAVGKALPSYKKCLTDLRAGKNDEAIADAQQGMTAYAQSSFARVCQLNALSNKKASADEIIASATALRQIDPNSMMALANLVEAYSQKGDTAKAIETNLAIYRLDPTNTALANSIVQQLANSGAPKQALPIVDSLLKDNPGDPAMLQTKWKLQLRVGDFKSALKTGEDVAKYDTAYAGTADYFNRMIGAAQSDSNPAKVQELAAKAAQRITTDASYSLLLAQGAIKSGQAQQAEMWARKATLIDPKNSDAWLFAVVSANQLNQPDSALAFAQQAVKSGADKDVLSQALLGVVAPAVKKAQDSKDRADWEAALKSAQTVDAVLPGPTTKFYVGLASFQVGLDALQNSQKLGAEKGKDAKESKAKACAEAKVAEDMWGTAQMSMPAGAAYNKDGATQVMGAIQQYSEYIPKLKTAYCGK